MVPPLEAHSDILMASLGGATRSPYAQRGEPEASERSRDGLLRP
jgi:hypothetical protein